MRAGSRAAAALAANHTGRPVKLRLPREVDMVTTGKRHGFDYRYTVGFDARGASWRSMPCWRPMPAGAST